MTTLTTSLERERFSAKDPAEIVNLGFDFSLLAPGLVISSPVVTAEVASGVDANPSAILAGSPTVVGSTVLQRVQGGLAGRNYLLRARVDAADGSRWVVSGVLPIRTG